MVDKIDKITPGEFKKIDDYVNELKAEGYEANYENIVSDPAGFIAILYVNGTRHAVWEGDMSTGGHMVRDVVTDLEDISKDKPRKEKMRKIVKKKN